MAGSVYNKMEFTLKMLVVAGFLTVLPALAWAAGPTPLKLATACYGYSQSAYYGYSQSAYYGYSQSAYYGYSQSAYYGYAQGYYYGYAQGYYYGYSQASYANTFKTSAPACGVAGTFASDTACTTASRTQACR